MKTEIETMQRAIDGAEPKASNYEVLRAVNVNPHVEKKSNLSYLSWAWAVDTMLLHDPFANWEYGDPKEFHGTFMVFCTVTMFGKRMTAHLPVMDHRNAPIKEPNAFQMNTAMQRCLAKAIALHGLGLYIYAGEDLPPDEHHQEEGHPEPKHEPKVIDQGAITEAQVLEIEARLSETGIMVESFLAKAGGLDSIKDISATSFGPAMGWILRQDQLNKAAKFKEQAKGQARTAPVGPGENEAPIDHPTSKARTYAVEKPGGDVIGTWSGPIPSVGGLLLVGEKSHRILEIRALDSKIPRLTVELAEKEPEEPKKKGIK